MRVNAEHRGEHAYPPGFSEARLDVLQRHAFEYFLRETNFAKQALEHKHIAKMEVRRATCSP